MGFETDPIALGVLFLALVAACVGFAAVFYLGMAEGLANRRSPTQVRMAAAATGLVFFGAVGSFATWGVIYAIVAVIAAAIILFFAGARRTPWTLVAVGVALALVAFLIHAPKHSKTPAKFGVGAPANASSASSAESAAESAITPPATKPAITPPPTNSSDADNQSPLIKPIAPKH